MGAHLLDRLHVVVHVLARAMNRIRKIAAVEIGIAEVLPRLRRKIQLAVGNIVAHQVAPGVIEVHRLARGVPVEAQRIPHAQRKGFKPRAIGVDALQRAEQGIVLLLRRVAIVAGHPDIEIKLAVRAEVQILPAVHLLLRQRVDHHHRLRRRVQRVFDILKLHDPADLRHVQRAILEGHAIGPPEFLRNHHRAVCLVVAVRIRYRIDISRALGAHKERSLVPQRHGTGARHVVGIHADGKAGRQGDFLQRKLRRNGRRNRQRQ